MLERRLEQQGIQRPLALLHRTVGRHLQRIDELDYRLRERLRAALEVRARARRDLEARLRRFDLRPRFAADRRRMDAARVARPSTPCGWPWPAAAARAAELAAKLGQLSPLAVLERGYAIVTDPAGAVLKRSAEAPPGAAIRVRLARGRLEARVEKSEK